MVDKKVEPRTFFLNESHEFTRGEKEGGGRPASYAPINWASRAAKLHSTLNATRSAVAASQDPLRERRFFMLAAPESKVTKTSKAIGKPPTFDEETRYSGEHSRVFRRLGVDLLHVASDGSAIVHATPDRVDQLTRTAAQLPKAGAKEQAR